MRIGIDIDDTICDTWEYLMPYLSEYFDIDINKLKNIKGKYYEACNCSYEEYCKFAKEYYSKFCMEYKLKENVVEIINRLKNDGHQIIFITARSNNGFNDAYLESKNYLEKNNIYYDKLIVNAKDKGKICVEEKIDLFIDDDINNCENVFSNGINVLLFNNKYSMDSCKKLKTVFNWNDVYLEVERLMKNG